MTRRGVLFGPTAEAQSYTHPARFRRYFAFFLFFLFFFFFSEQIREGCLCWRCAAISLSSEWPNQEMTSRAVSIKIDRSEISEHSRGRARQMTGRMFIWLGDPPALSFPHRLHGGPRSTSPLSASHGPPRIQNNNDGKSLLLVSSRKTKREFPCF
jgi:hypothetical protein